ncbi:unnamed protein product, partial [Closterium sp. NIES-53]
MRAARSSLTHGLTTCSSPAPPATADSATHSQWLTHDAAARLAIRNHLPLAECAHFSQHRTAQALYDAVVARYSSPATAALGHLLLPYLFPELSTFAMVEDLVTHLRTSDARYRAALLAEFLSKNPPLMYITLYFIVTRLPDSLRAVRDHILALDPTALTVDLLEQHLLAAETSVVAVGAAHGTPHTPFFEGTSGVLPASAKHHTNKGKGGRGGGGGSGGGGGGSGGGGWGSSGGGGGSGGDGSGGSGGGSGGLGGGGGGRGGSGGSGSSRSGGGWTRAQRGGSGGGQRQQQQRREWFAQSGTSVGSVSCPYAIRTGDRAGQTCGKLRTQHRCFSRLDDVWRAEFGDEAERPRWAELLSESVLPGTMPAKALHTFTLDSGASHCFFRDSTTLTPLSAPVPVRLADPSGGPVLAHSSTVHPCPAVLSGSLSRLHLPSFSTNMVSTAALQDAMVTTTTPGDPSVAPPPGSPLPATPSWHALPPPSLWSSQVSPSPPTLACPALPSLCRGAAAHRSSLLLVSPDDCSPADSPHGHPLPPKGPAPSGVSQVDPLPSTALVEVAVGSGAAPGAAPQGAASRGAAPGGAEPGVAEPGGEESEGAGSGGAEPRGEESEGAGSRDAEPWGAELRGAEPTGRTRLWSGATGAGDSTVGDTGAGGAGVTAGGGGIGGGAAAGRGGAHTRGTGAAGTGGVGGAGARDPTELGVAGAGGAGAVGAGAGGAGAGGAGAVDPGAGGARGIVRPRPYFFPLLQQVLGVPSSTGLTPPLLCPPPDQSQLPLQPASSVPTPSPYTEQIGGLTEHREPASRPASLVRSGSRFPRQRPPPVPGTHAMTLRPSSVPLHVPLPPPPESSLLAVPDPESDRARAANPTVSRLLATVVTDPSFESTAASSRIAELVDFAVACRLDYATALVAESESGEAAFKARYVARGFSQRQGVDYFQTFSPNLKMTTLRVSLHVAAQRDYDLHWPVYDLRQAPCEWHSTPRTTLAALEFTPSTADPSLFLRTNTLLPAFYVLVYVDDLVFATASTEALTLVKSELQKRHTSTNLGELRSYLGLQITQDRARRTITLTQSHMVHQVLQRFGFQFSSPQPTPLSTSHLLSAPPSNESVELSGPYPELVGCL